MLDRAKCSRMKLDAAKAKLTDAGFTGSSKVMINEIAKRSSNTGATKQ